MAAIPQSLLQKKKKKKDQDQMIIEDITEDVKDEESKNEDVKEDSKSTLSPLLSSWSSSSSSSSPSLSSSTPSSSTHSTSTSSSTTPSSTALSSTSSASTSSSSSANGPTTTATILPFRFRLMQILQSTIPPLIQTLFLAGTILLASTTWTLFQYQQVGGGQSFHPSTSSSLIIAIYVISYVIWPLTAGVYIMTIYQSVRFLTYLRRFKHKTASQTLDERADELQKGVVASHRILLHNDTHYRWILRVNQAYMEKRENKPVHFSIHKKLYPIVCNKCGMCIDFVAASQPVKLSSAQEVRFIIDSGHRCSYCIECKQPRTDRTFHCHTCKTCVNGKDHHCPFVGTCLSFETKRPFVVFLFWAMSMCIMSFSIATFKLFSMLVIEFIIFDSSILLFFEPFSYFDYLVMFASWTFSFIFIAIIPLVFMRSLYWIVFETQSMQEYKYNVLVTPNHPLPQPLRVALTKIWTTIILGDVDLSSKSSFIAKVRLVWKALTTPQGRFTLDNKKDQ